MRKGLVSIIFLLGVISTQAQQLPQWSSFYENGFIWNPALTAKWNKWELAATHSQEWVGFDDAPQYSTLSFQFPFVSRRTKTSVGSYMSFDEVGPFKSITLAGTYAYRIRPLLFGNRDDRLTMGILLRFEQYRYDPNNLIAFDLLEGDQNILIETDNRYIPNTGAGFLYKSESENNSFRSHYYFGASLNNLIPTKLTDLSYGELHSALHGTLLLGYRHSPNRSKSYIEPNIFVSYGFANAVNVMANIRYELKGMYWLSGGAASNGEVFIQAGFIMEEMGLFGVYADGARLGIKFDRNFGSLRRYRQELGFEIYFSYLFELEY